MGTQNRVGPKRLVVGAHYGLGEWLAQRITAIVVAVYTLVLLVLFFGARNFSYEGWASIFAMQWMKLATFVALLSLFYHAYVGMRDIWMDYVKPVGLRLFLTVLTVLWLIGCAGYAAQILWRV
ncbi:MULTISPECIES: succinate dehydrogenase, hydrophobic membrane anchor protein [unclassified Caballeronia]|uniref:succinate dehydrogenase, hydrophobic membrane anchor protein n=1 Tax=unclassified Caballeronia TaxID=2646786 RepID=UPI0028545ECB|nr:MULTISPECIES: succinate dehydrogenase, hydrophobic membrane anchor protein [unclassified Caballeronia]MDR5739092.1 succinate dehydrogenase, hydrophobic membrane anchor protein [Caballeronia sp. LZ016]MDR5807580.1 succinate dehydrogenase, hydrophobic membrane anchor protein [Caballeronia sp. LZ019]